MAVQFILFKPALVFDAWTFSMNISQQPGDGVGDAGWQHALWECHSVHSPEERRAWRPHHCVCLCAIHRLLDEWGRLIFFKNSLFRIDGNLKSLLEIRM